MKAGGRLVVVTALKGGNAPFCSTHMMDGQHQEGPTPCTLCHHGNEAGIDRAEVVVVDTACDGHTVVAALSAGRLSQNLTEL